MKRVAVQTVALLLESGDCVFAATSRTLLDTVAQQVMWIVSGPIALLFDHRWVCGIGDYLLPGAEFRDRLHQSGGARRRRRPIHRSQR